MEWTYYEEGECESTYSTPDFPDFYGPCYRDRGRSENIFEEVDAAKMNPLIFIEVKEGTVYKRKFSFVLC